jgi:mono/diheme cytochrome c family protein
MENGSENSVSNLFYVLLGFSVWLLLLANFWRQPAPALPAHLVRTDQPAAVAAQSTVALAVVEATPEVDPAVHEASLGDADRGQQLYASTCSACHGPNGEGVQGLGKDMRHSEFIAGLSDAELLTFLKVGRDMSDPLNTTGVAMPPKGGNPALNDEQLTDIIAFMRSIHE